MGFTPLSKCPRERSQYFIATCWRPAFINGRLLPDNCEGWSAMSVLDQLIRSLEATKGDLHAKAVVGAEFLLSALPEVERTPLRAALDAATVLRWFDASLLEQVLEISANEATQRFRELRAMSFVERFPSHDRELSNVHEATRLGWRKRLAREEPERFQILSARAAICFASNLSSTGRIEWIYHLLCAEPEHAATELEKLSRDWHSSARPEERYALATALKELEDLELVNGRPLVWIRLVRAWTDQSRGQTAGLAEAAHFILKLAASLFDMRAEADAQCMLGDSFEVEGKLDDAASAFKKSLSICQQLAEQDPDNAGWQRDLATAHSRVGEVFKAQGRLAEAQTAFTKDLAISQQLAEQDPSDAGRQRDLGVAHSKMGGVFEAQGRLAEAQAAFTKDFVISQQLATQDPSNAGWQRDFAVAHARVGDVFKAQGKLAEALEAFTKRLAISQQLAAVGIRCAIGHLETGTPSTVETLVLAVARSRSIAPRWLSSS
jgi:tetratricopeptide (TPR) repeat protein